MELKVIGIDMATEPSKTAIFVTGGRKGFSARCTAMARVLRGMGYDVSVEDVRQGIYGLRPTSAIIDDLPLISSK